MADDVIDTFINKKAIAEEADFVLAKLNEIYSAYQKLNTSIINFQRLKGGKNVAASLNEITIAQNKYIKSTEALVKRKKEEVDTEVKLIKIRKDGASEKLKDERLTKDLTNDYKQLSLAYNDAALKAKNYSLILGSTHPLSVQAIADAGVLGTKLKTLDASVGQYQRNVGNYAGGIAEAGKKAFAFVRNAANILPGLGLSGAFLLIFEGVKAAAQALGLFNDKLSDTARRQKIVNDALKEGTENAQQEIVKLDLFKNKLTDLNIPASERLKILKEYNKIADNTNKIDEDQIDNLGLINIKINEQNGLILKRAISTAALAKLTDASTKLVDAELSLNLLAQKTGLSNSLLEKELQLLAKRADAIGLDFRLNGTQREQKEELFRQTGKNLNLTKLEIAQLGNLFEAKKKATDELSNINKALSPLITTEGLTTTDTKDKKTKDTSAKDAKEAAKEAKEAADKELQLAFDIQAITLKQQIDFNKEIADDETKSAQDRLIALRRFSDASTELIELKAALEKKLGNKSSLEIEKIETEKYDSLLRLAHTFSLQAEKIRADFNKKFEKDAKDLQAALTKIAEDGTKKYFDEEEKKRQLRIKIGEDLLKEKKRIAEEEKKLFNDLYRELSETVTAFFNLQQDKQLSQIQKEIDELERKKQKDIEVVNQTVINKDAAASEIIIIEARSQAAREQLEIRQREIEKKKANIERLGQAATIVGNTASGVLSLSVKAAEAKAQALLLASNPFTAAFAPIAAASAAAILTQIPIVIGIGVAQIARLALPKYKHGKNVNDNYEGPAIVGDGGRSELIQREDGSMEVTPARPTITYVKSKDIILPDAKKALAEAAMNETGKALMTFNSGASTVVDNSTPQIIAGLKDVTKAISKIPQQNITVDNILSKRIRGAGGFTNYIQRNIN